MAPTFAIGNAGYHLRTIGETKEENPVPGTCIKECNRRKGAVVDGVRGCTSKSMGIETNNLPKLVPRSAVLFKGN
jgi:hypothetical protein